MWGPVVAAFLTGVARVSGASNITARTLLAGMESPVELGTSSPRDGPCHPHGSAGAFPAIAIEPRERSTSPEAARSAFMSTQRSSDPQQHRARRAPRGGLDRLAVESKLPSVAVELPPQLEIGLEIHHRPVRVGLQERQVADGLDHRAILETVKDPGLAAAVARARRGGGTPQQRVLKRPF